MAEGVLQANHKPAERLEHGRHNPPQSFGRAACKEYPQEVTEHLFGDEVEHVGVAAPSKATPQLGVLIQTVHPV